MIDINTPSTLSGIALVALIVFVVASAVITTGTWPILIAVIVGAVAVYIALKFLKGVDRRVTRIFSGGES